MSPEKKQNIKTVALNDDEQTARRRVHATMGRMLCCPESINSSPLQTSLHHSTPNPTPKCRKSSLSPHPQQPPANPSPLTASVKQYYREQRAVVPARSPSHTAGLITHSIATFKIRARSSPKPDTGTALLHCQQAGESEKRRCDLIESPRERTYA